MGKKACTPLIVEQQIDAVKAAYAGKVDYAGFGPSYPALSHLKRPVFETAQALRKGLEGKALHREACKALKQPVPLGCHTTDEMRLALVAHYFKEQDGVSISYITDLYGPSRTTLWRQTKRVVAALKLAGFGDGDGKRPPTRANVSDVVSAIDFPTGGRTAYFLPDEERLLLEMAALHAEHGVGKSKRLTLNYAKRAVAHMAEKETDPEVKRRLTDAKLSRNWLMNARGRVAMANGGDMYKDVKPSLLSQTRAAAKKPGQNAAMFAQIQVGCTHARALLHALPPFSPSLPRPSLRPRRVVVPAGEV